MPLVVQPPLLLAAARLGRPARGRRRGDRLPDGLGQPFPGRLAVAQLGPVLGGGDGQHAVNQSARQPPGGALLQRFGQGLGRQHVPGQLHPRIGGVHALPAGPGGAGEPPAEFPPGDGDGRRDEQIGIHVVPLGPSAPRLLPRPVKNGTRISRSTPTAPTAWTAPRSRRQGGNVAVKSSRRARPLSLHHGPGGKRPRPPSRRGSAAAARNSGAGALADRRAEPADRVELHVRHALLHRDDRVVRDLDVLRADLGAALGDVAHADAVLGLGVAAAVELVGRVHVELGQPDEEPRAGEGFLVVLVVTDHVAHVLAHEALDALAELLAALHVDLLHPQLARLGAGRRRERRHLPRLGVVERHVGDQVPDDREGPQRGHRDRLGLGEGVHPGHAHQPGLAVDLGAAGAALAGLAVPADGQVRGLGRLQPVDDVEDDLALVHLDLELLQHAAGVVAAPDLHLRRVGHLARPFRQQVQLGLGQVLLQLAALEQADQLRRHAGQRLAGQLDRPVLGLRADQVDLTPLRVGLGVVVPGVAAPALLALQRGLGHAFADGEHVAQVQGQVPARVELPVPLDGDAGGALLELLQPAQCLFHLLAATDDADQVVHRLLQLLVQRVRVLPALGRERRQGRGRGRVHLGRVDPRPGGAQAVDVGGGTQAGPAAEDQQVGEAVAAEAVGAVHPAGNLTGGEQTRHHRDLRVGLDLDPAHHVVTGRADLHRLGGDVDVRQFLELVVHRRQPLDDLGRRQPGGDVQEDPAVGRAAAGLDLGVDRARDLVPGQQLRGAAVVRLVVVPAVGLLLGLRVLRAEDVGDVAEHEPLALGVLQHPAVTADRLGDQDPLDARRPDHSGRVELDELHVHQRRAGPHRQRVAVPGVLPGVAGDLEALADPAGGQDHGRGLEDDEPAGLAPVAERPGDRAVGLQQLGDRALGEDLDLRLVVTELLEVLLLQGDDLLLQGADHLQTGAVTDVGQPRELVAAEVALADPAVLGAVEQRAPQLQLPDPLRRLLGVQFSHPVVVQELAAAHRVAEVDLPVVVGVHVAHGGRDPALGHHGVGLAEQRLADDRGPLALQPSLDRGPQTGPTGSDHDHVVGVALGLRHETSFIVVSIFESVGSEEARVADGAGRDELHVEVGQSHAEQRDPGVARVVAVEPGDPGPELVADRVPGEVVQPPADRVPAGVAAQRVQPQQRRVHQQHHRAQAHVAPVAVVITETQDRVVGQDHVEDQAGVEEPAVRVLDDQGEARLAGVRLVRLGHGAPGRRQPEGPVVRLAVVVAGHPETEREDQDDQRRRQPPPGAEGGDLAAAGDAVRGQAGGVQRGDVRRPVVVPVLERPPGRVDHEAEQHREGDERLQPPLVRAQRPRLDGGPGGAAEGAVRAVGGRGSPGRGRGDAHRRIPITGSGAPVPGRTPKGGVTLMASLLSSSGGPGARRGPPARAD